MRRVTCGDARTVQPSLTRPASKKEKEKSSSPPLENIKQPLRCSVPPSRPSLRAPARVYFHARPLHFLTSSRLSTSSLKRGHDSLKRSDLPRTDHTKGGGNENWNPCTCSTCSLFLRCSIRARLKRKLQRRRGRSTSGSG